MQELLKNYSLKTQGIAKFHGIYHKETLNLIEALLEKHPKIYEFRVIDGDIERAIQSYLKKYHPEFSVDYENHLFFIEEREPTPRQLLEGVCKVLGIAIAVAIVSKIASKYTRESIQYPHKDTWMLDSEGQKESLKALEKDLNFSPRRK